jgi:hypothetical protein
MEPPPGADPGLPPYRGRVTAVCDGGVCPRGFDPPQPFQITWPSITSVYRSATCTWSRHPVPTRAIRRTKAEPQPCAAASLPGKDSNLNPRDQNPLSCH